MDHAHLAELRRRVDRSEPLTSAEARELTDANMHAMVDIRLAVRRASEPEQAVPRLVLPGGR